MEDAALDVRGQLLHIAAGLLAKRGAHVTVEVQPAESSSMMIAASSRDISEQFGV